MFEYPLSDEHKMLWSTVRDFAKTEIAPKAREIDEKAEFPVKIFSQMADLGFLGAAIPPEYGGSGMDLMAVYTVVEEISTELPSLGMDYMVTAGVIGYHSISKLGTESQKKRYLPRLVSGEMIGAIGMTEPNAGSDVAAMKTRAHKTKDGYYLLNGTKTLITNFGGPLPSVGVFIAVTDPALGKRGMTSFLVEKDFPGVSVSKSLDTCGMRSSSQSEISFEDCPIPEENVLSSEGKGMSVSLSGIDVDRILCCALSTGIARGVYERAVRYAKQRFAFGQPIIQFPSVQTMLSKIATYIHASRLLGHYAVRTYEQGKRCTVEAAMAKRVASQHAQEATIWAMHILGGYGYCREYEVERFFRDNMGVEIGGGAAELLEALIGQSVIDYPTV
ncbi:MAG: acyl-CoA dehydrogenase family protein [Acidobacteriota bacterium]